MTTIWLLWAVLTLTSPKADAVIVVDEFTNKVDCSTAMKALGHELASMNPNPQNINHITLNCIPVGTRN